MADGSAAPVVAGLAVGAAFVILFSTLFVQSSANPILEGEYQPRRPGKIADAAVKVAMENGTLQQLFKGREVDVTSVRDWGVSTVGGDCPIDWCAIILFDDKSDDIVGFASATVNVKSAKVVDFSLHQDILIEKASDTKEAGYFVSKYPEARLDVKRDGSSAMVEYSVARQIGEPPDSVMRERVLEIIFDKANLMTEPLDFRLYCVNGPSTPATGGDMTSRIDDESCFGK